MDLKITGWNNLKMVFNPEDTGKALGELCARATNVYLKRQTETPEEKIRRLEAENEVLWNRIDQLERERQGS